MLEYKHNNFMKKLPKVSIEFSIMTVLITVIVCLIASMLFVAFYEIRS